MIEKRVMLTYALSVQVKMEIKNKFYIEGITFATFKTLNTHISKKTLYICLLNLCSKDTS